MEYRIKIGATSESTITVDANNTAIAAGSGDMPVFATPAMIALAEKAAMKAAEPFLGEDESTVGSYIAMSHTRPSGLGEVIVAKAVVTFVDDRRVVFTVSARDSSGVIGEGDHVRFIVDRHRFLSKVK